MNGADVVRDEKAERLHPAAFGVLLFMLVSIGRLPELLTVLAPLHLGKVAPLIALLGVLIASSRPRVPVFTTGPGRLLVILMGLATASVAFSFWKSHSLSFVLGHLLANMLLFFLLVKTTTGPRMLKFYIRGIVICGLLLALTMVRAGGVERVSIISSYDPNDLAMVLVVILPIALVGFYASRGLRRYVLGGISGLMLLAILMTSSRGGFLALLAVGGYLLMVQLPAAGGRLDGRFSPVKVLGLVFAGVLLLVATPQAAWDRVSTVFTPEDDYNLTDETGRVAIWKRGIAAMAVRPWGYGVDVFGAVEGELGGRHQAAHNSFIQIGVELGLAGLALFLALLRTCWVRLGALRARYAQSSGPDPAARTLLIVATALKAGFIGYLVAGFFLSAAYAAILFALIAITMAAENVAKMQEETPSEPPAAPDGHAAPGGVQVISDRRRADTGYGY